MNIFSQPHKKHRSLPLALFLAILGLLVLVFPSLAQVSDGGKTSCEGSKVCGPDLVVDYYYDDHCNLHIVITNIGMAPVTIGGNANPNVVGLIRADGSMGLLGMGTSPVTLGSGQSHEIFISANFAATLIGLLVDPNNTINETDETNNQVDVIPCLPDLVVSYYYDDNCNMYIVITNIGIAPATIGGGNNPNVIGTLDINGVSGFIGMGNSPVILGSGESHEIFLPADFAATLVELTVDPNGTIDESDEDNNSTAVEPCEPEPVTRTVCHATVDPYLNNYENGSLKASMCLTVTIDGSVATLSGYGRNLGLAPIGPAPADTTTTVACRIRQNGVFQTGTIGWDFATWNLHRDVPVVTAAHQPGDSYTMTCEHEWDVPSTNYYLFTEPAPITITP